MKGWVLAMTLASAPLLAETNFTGNWMLNLAKSQYGAFPAPEVMIRTVEHNGSALKMSTYQKGAQGELTTELAYATDGRESVNGANRGAARWQGESLVIESRRESQGAQLTQHEVWTLSADGKTLTVVTKVTLPQQGEFEVRQVFEKTPQAGGASRVSF